MMNDPIHTETVPVPPRRASSSKWIVPAALGFVVLAGGGGYLAFLKSKAAPAVPAPESVATAAAPTPTEAIEEPEAAPGPAAAKLPALDASDDLFREWARRAMGAASIDRWITQPGLVRQLAAAVATVAEGESPRALLPFLGPSGKFEVEERDEQLFAARTSFARYDGIASVLLAMDPQTAAVAVKTLTPLLNQAWREIGRPGTTFNSALNDAFSGLLAVPVVQGDIELVEKGAVYAYADPSLEALTPAQKHLLRMGPDNVRKLQSKIRKLRDALGYTSARR